MKIKCRLAGWQNKISFLIFLFRLNYLFKRPNSQEVKNRFEKTLALKIMSLDLNTAEKTDYSRQKGSVQLPRIG